MADRIAIIAATEALLDREGFSGTGMDRLTKAAGVSTRTLYKHVGGRAGLITAALEARNKRFVATMPRDGTDALFRALAAWVGEDGGCGCFFLRALSEAGSSDPVVCERVAAHKSETADLIAACVASDLGRPLEGEDDWMLVDEVFVLFEGATQAAAYRGPSAVDVARRASATLVRAAQAGVAQESSKPISG